jgi:signal transduction histidine kinase
LKAPETEGFAPALRRYSDTFAQRHGISLEFETVGAAGALDPAAENGLFRIAQEALVNVVKHAEASAARLTLTYGRDYVEMTVEDNGKGMDADAPPGSGLENMKARAGSAGGELTVGQSALGGVRVTARVKARSAAHE